MITKIHLKGGKIIRGLDWARPSDAEMEEVKEKFENLVISDPSDGWRLSVDTRNGWVVIPGSSVLYIELAQED